MEMGAAWRYRVPLSTGEFSAQLLEIETTFIINVVHSARCIQDIFQAVSCWNWNVRKCVFFGIGFKNSQHNLQEFLRNQDHQWFLSQVTWALHQTARSDALCHICAVGEAALDGEASSHWVACRKHQALSEKKTTDRTITTGSFGWTSYEMYTLHLQ